VDVLQFNVMEKNGIVSGCIGCGVYDHPMLKGWRVGGNMGWGGKASQFVFLNVGCSLLAILKYRGGKIPQFVFLNVGCSPLAMLKYRGVRLRSLSPSMWEAVFLLC
jgi:hypothetical protein